MITSEKSIFQILNLTEYKHNLYSANTLYQDKQLEYYKIQAKSVNADYFYCFNSLVENRPIPFIYIYDQRTNSQKRTINLVDINRQLWTLGEISIAVIVYDNEIKIIDTRNPIKNELEPSYLDGLAQSIKRIDDILKRRLFEGRILEESPADYISVSPYQKLLDHIEKAILNKSKRIGCKQELLKKILVKFILIKYLEEQVDEEGNSVFEKGFFNKFITQKNDLFIDNRDTFCDVLRENCIIELFGFLNAKFNGGIFKISDEEKSEIQSSDFSIIANALDGNQDSEGQMSIWRYYDFNLLPIEFISRLYERFVTSVEGQQKDTGAFYTPPHLARLLIDELLPFNKEIDFDNYRILDPSCGSGIFLVLAYKRLITLWMLKYSKQGIKGEEDIKCIKEILSKCIYGVDINKDALSITATSLQIELSSHIRPKEIWDKLTFNNLETEGNLHHKGFFKWYKSTTLKFNIIAGNPPFNISKKEQEKNIKAGRDDDFSQESYIDYNGKLQSFPDNNPALIILYKCVNNLLQENDGVLFMIMPSSTFLYMPSSSEYKQNLVSFWNIERIYDFTPLRSHLWGKTNIATIAVKISNSLLVSERERFIEHIIVRNSSANEKGSIRFQIDKYDKFNVPIDFIFSKISIWKINLLGGGRLSYYIEKYNNQYKTISSFFKEKKILSCVGYQRDKSAIDDLKLREKGERVINLNKKTAIISRLFNKDEIDSSMLDCIEVDDWVRIPANGLFTPPNILIRLNINANIPISYNNLEIMIPNGILTIKGDNEEIMRKFVSTFKENRNFYKVFINATSPKTHVQQNNEYTINAQDILNLPINTDSNGNPIPFEQTSEIEKVVIEETTLIMDNLKNSESIIFQKINPEILAGYGEAFCEILNFTYEKDNYKFKLIRKVINDDYVWIVFEHTNKDITIETTLTSQSQKEFENILYDNTTNNALTLNRIIIYYGSDNQISFIKPNKLKYWMRTIAYRDAENVKSDMFKYGY